MEQGIPTDDLVKFTRSLYSHLLKRRSDDTDYFLAAKNIRIELRLSFPKTYFKVRSGMVFPEMLQNEFRKFRWEVEVKRVSPEVRPAHISHVLWAGDPTPEEVRKVVAKFELGTFDPSVGTYIYSPEQLFHALFGGVEYVFLERIPLSSPRRPRPIRELQKVSETFVTS